MLRRAVVLWAACVTLTMAVDPALAQTATDDSYTVKKPPKQKPEPATPQPPEPRASEPTPPSAPTPQAAPPRQPQPSAPTQQVRPETQPPSVPVPTGQAVSPAPTSTPAPVAERVLRNKIGSDGLQSILNKASEMAVPGAGAGRGAPNADKWFDVTKPGDPSARDTAVPSGTPVFQGRPPGSGPQTQPTPQLPPGVQLQQSPPIRIQRVEPPPPVINGGYKPATPQDVKGVKENYGGIPGGVVLEGVATGLGRIDRVSYDPKFNAVSLDDRAVYFAKVPPRTLAVMCRAIAQDDRVGVSLGRKHIVYGAVPPDSALAGDLKLADHFLGDIVFAEGDWTSGYRFPNGFRPRANEDKTGHVAVFFNFNGFAFAIEQEEVRLTAASFDVRLVPLTEQSDENGAHQPDIDAVARGAVSRQYEANARHIAEHIGYYQRERIISRTFAYGEAAAFVRGLKRAGVDLQRLANTIEAETR